MKWNETIIYPKYTNFHVGEKPRRLWTQILGMQHVEFFPTYTRSFGQTGLRDISKSGKTYLFINIIIYRNYIMSKSRHPPAREKVLDYDWEWIKVFKYVKYFKLESNIRGVCNRFQISLNYSKRILSYNDEN